MECSFHPFFDRTAIVCFFHLYIILNPIYYGVLFSYFLCSNWYCVLFPSIYNIEPYLLWSALFHTFFVQTAIVCFFHLYIILNPIYHVVLFSYFLCSSCYCVLFPSIYNIEPYLPWSALFIFSLFKLLLCAFSIYIQYWPLSTMECSFSYFLCSNCYCVLFPSIYNIEPYLPCSALFILSLLKLLLCAFSIYI